MEFELSPGPASSSPIVLFISILDGVREKGVWKMEAVNNRTWRSFVGRV